MEISQFALAKLYFLAVFVGIGLGMLYDTMRITRVFLGVRYTNRATDQLYNSKLPLLPPLRRKKESPFLGTVIFFEDLFFGIFCGISMILLFYEANNGNVRWLSILFAIGGFFAYRYTIGRLVMLFSEVIAFALETAIRYLFFFILFPFRWIWKKAYTLLCQIYFNKRNEIRKKERIRYTEKESTRIAQGCGMLESNQHLNKRRLKRGRIYGNSKIQKAVQPEHVDANIHCDHHCRLFNCFRNQHHEIQ